MRLEIYRRADDRWAWRLVAYNGRIVATDGGQGYENRQDVLDITGTFLAAHAVDETKFTAN